MKKKVENRVENRVENGALQFWKPWICKDEKKTGLHLSLTVGNDFATEFYSTTHQSLRFNNFELFSESN